MISTSLKGARRDRSGKLLSLPPTPPSRLAQGLGTACTGLSCDGLGGYFWNSMSFTVHPAVLISTMIGAVNNYVLTMWRFRGGDLLFDPSMMGCFIPFRVVAAADGQDAGRLGIASSVTGLVFVHVVLRPGLHLTVLPPTTTSPFLR